jgi:hypothetical protein
MRVPQDLSNTRKFGTSSNPNKKLMERRATRMRIRIRLTNSSRKSAPVPGAPKKQPTGRGRLFSRVRTQLAYQALTKSNLSYR